MARARLSMLVRHSDQSRLRTSRWICRAALGAAAVGSALAITACGDAPAAGLPTSVPAANAAQAAANAISVSPLPGTSDASPTTQISFLGGAGTTVADVKVTGARSGRHSGRLEAYSTGTGESFLPSHRFASGERVNVSARVTGGAASAKTVKTMFTIAYQAPISQAQFPLKAGNPEDVQHYLSAPGLTPSSVRITTPAQPGAVSYTHLDVYKRQRQLWPGVIFATIGWQLIQALGGIYAVSYTHLDVYKRQVQRSTRCWPTRMATECSCRST